MERLTRLLVLGLAIALCHCADSKPQEAADDALPTDSASAGSDSGEPANNDAETRDTQSPNILLIISDDLGLGSSQCYNVGTNLPPMPNIESLCKRGMVFDNMWSAPTCSPTRASMLTGRYPFRTGVGEPPTGGAKGLDVEEWIIPRVLNGSPELGYSHACIGKWHVGPPNNKTHAETMGFDHFSGLLIGTVNDYFSWKETNNNKTTTVTEYATSRHVTQAIDWVEQQKNPWFLWLALVSPHAPFHLPPKKLHSYNELSGSEQDLKDNPNAYYRAMIEAMDREIGRLFAGIGEEQMANTIVIYLGDNGSPGQVAEAPYTGQKSKGTLYQGGVHVPFVVAGPGITAAPGRSSALTHVVDIFHTILELAGVNMTKLPGSKTRDGVSLVPLLTGTKDRVRDWMMTEQFGDNSPPKKAGQAIRDNTYKLIRLKSGKETFYNLKNDPYEASPLTIANLQATALERYKALGKLLDDLKK